MSTKKKKRKYSYGRILGRLFSCMGDQKPLLAFLLFSIIVGTICLTLAPTFLSNITDSLSEAADGGSVDFRYIRIQCAILVAAYVIGHAAKWLDNRTSVLLSQNVVQRLRNQSQEKLNRLPLSYIDAHPAGDILSRLTNDMVTLSNTMDSTMTKMVSDLLTLFGILAAMLLMSPALTLIFLVMLPVSYLSVSMISRVTKPLFTKQQRCVGEINAYLSDLYSNHVLVESFSYGDRAEEQFGELNGKFRSTYIRSRFVSGFILPLSRLINNLAYIALCVAGAVLLYRGSISLGEFQAFLIYANMISSPINSISTSFNNFQLGLAAAERVFEFLDEEEEEKETEKKALPQEAVGGGVGFSHVQFGYRKDQLLMKDVNFQIQPGQTAAIVGPSGAGKTTLVNLLMRFYEISGGSICFGEENLREYTKESVRRSFGMVLQDTWIFDGTIAENIGYGKPGATREEIVRAARTVQCDTFIDKLPDGYDTRISATASVLSSGELQLLAIARTIIANPPILILDEATSQVDTKTEALITEAMARIMEGRTCFIIAHRLFTIRNADVIIYMEDGDIKEVGNHAGLMEKQGRYAALYNSASD